MKKLYTTLLTTVIGLSTMAQTVIYVDDDATGKEDGTSWKDAYTDLNDALSKPSKDSTYIGAHIWIAEGFYTRTDKTESFEVNDDVLLFGGFAGTESSIDERDIESHPTIISGDVDWNDTGAPSSSNSSMLYNSANVFKVLSTTRALFDGLIIERAYSTTETGGGIYVVNSSLENLQISNCIIRENVSDSKAGVMFHTDFNYSGFYLFNTRIEDNVNTDGSYSNTLQFALTGTTRKYADVHFVNNLFKNNTTEAKYSMGTIANFLTHAGSRIDLYLTNNTFVDNPQTGQNSDSVSALIEYQHGGGGGRLTAFLNNNIFYNNPGVTDVFGEKIQGSSVTGDLSVPSTNSFQNVQDFADNFNLQNTHVVTSSPFVDDTNGNYSPIAAYQTIGDSTYYDSQYLNYPFQGQAYPTTDLAGNPRFDADKNLAIGAFQFAEEEDDVTTSVNDIENTALRVYPNPFHDVVKVEATALIQNVVVSNNLGQEIIRFQEINSSEFMFDAEQLNTGVYYVVISLNNGQQQTKRLIK